MQPVRRTQAFTNGEAQFGGPPGGFVWSVQLNVPAATNSDTFQLYINGEQLTSTTGTGLMGPVQVFSGETVTIKSSTVAAATKAFLYGQLDKVGQQPSGIFPLISGGVVTTTASYPLSTPLSGELSDDVPLTGGTLTAIFTTPTLAVGTWLVTFVFVPTAAGTDGQVQMGTATGSISGVGSASGGASYQSATLTCLVTITAAGNLTLAVESLNGGSILSASGQYSFPGATGWTATRVA